VLKVIHLTDLHLTPPGETIFGLDPNARLQAAIADINASHRDAALVLLTGDLTQDAGLPRRSPTRSVGRRARWRQ
jgi:3',5'-cyclic-AMP phosphodiesterase